jgi:hypothetical protein
MLLKVSAKEAYGVNMKLSLCEGDADDPLHGWERQAAAACSGHSSQIGNHEILYVTVSKGKAYSLVLDYTNSILSLSSFYDCPHAKLKVSMTRLEEARQLVSEHAADTSITQKKSDSEASLANFFDALSRPAGGLGSNVYRLEPDAVYSYPLDVRMGPQAQSHIVTRRDFSVQGGEARQFLLEVYYDS